MPSTPLVRHRINSSNLPDKWRRFADEYANNGYKPKEAAIVAGYSAKTAHRTANKLLKKHEVARYIGRIEAKRFAANELNNQFIIDRTVRILTFNPLHYFKPGKKDGTWEITDPNTLPEEVGQLIKTMKVKNREYDDGSVETYFEVVMMDKDAALQLGARILGLLTDRVQIGVAPPPKLDYSQLRERTAEDVPDTVEQAILEVEGKVKK